MKINKYLMLFLLVGNLYAQVSDTFPYKTTLQVQQQIELAMKNKYGNEYPLDKFVIMDSLINKTPRPWFSEEQVKDPYGTVKGLIIFTCQGPLHNYDDFPTAHHDSSIVGIMKNSNIQWDSGPVILGDLFGQFLFSGITFCDDINLDGKVEIGFDSEFGERVNGYAGAISKSLLWIISWDGVNAKLINDYNPNTCKSNIEGGPFYLYDWEGDGIKEITSDDYPITTYGWNGEKYGRWSNIHQVRWDEFYPAQWLTAIVKGKATKVNNNLRFDYEVSNSPGSKQKINEIYIDNINLPMVDQTLSKGSSTISSYQCLMLGNAWLFEPRAFQSYINPGETKTGYWYIGQGLPGICEIYIQGKRPLTHDIDSTKEITIDMMKDDVHNNSYKTYSIGLKAIPQVIDSIGFIDTIRIFNERATQFGWIKTSQTKDKYAGYLTNAKTALQQNNILVARTNMQNILRDVDIDSVNAITSEAYALLKYNTEYLLSKLPIPPSGNYAKLVNSSNTKLLGGSLQYYEGAWKDAVNNNDGTFTIPTTLKTVSLRMNYAYGSQTKSNVTIGADTVVFQTTNVQVKLLDSKGAILDSGKVQYYSGAWREFGSIANGIVVNELLPNSYSFRMNYMFASRDKVQDINANNVVVFQTVPATVQLKNSLGNLIDQGTVQYYSGAWRDFGKTTNGVAVKELLPNSYSFRMNYAFASRDKVQDISANNVVVFQTVPVTVQLKNSSGSFIDAGTVQYYSGVWRDFGITTDGIVVKELLPNSYSFRMNYASANLDKTQNIGTDPTVVFQTVSVTVQLKNSLGNLIDQGNVQYYSGAWRDFGATTNGIVVKELLPNSYSFRMNYASANLDKTQNIGTDPTVVFQTVSVTVQLKNSLGNLIDRGNVQYYSGTWRDFGATTNGIVVKELLPNSYSFRMTHEFVSMDKTQNIGTNNVVLFNTVLARINILDALSQPVTNAIVSYYSGAWRQIGNTASGVITKELLPVNLSFRALSGTKQADKTQNLSINNNVEIKLP